MDEEASALKGDTPRSDAVVYRAFARAPFTTADAVSPLTLTCRAICTFVIKHVTTETTAVGAVGTAARHAGGRRAWLLACLAYMPKNRESVDCSAG